MYPCSTVNELTFWNMLKAFLQYMMHCTHFLHLIDQLVLEHVCHGQFSHLDKHNIWSFTSISVWKIFPTGIREIHQLTLSTDIILSIQVRYWCIFHSSIILQAQSLIYLISIKSFTNPSKCTSPEYDENFSNLCTAKLKYTIVYK